MHKATFFRLTFGLLIITAMLFSLPLTPRPAQAQTPVEQAAS